MTFSFWTFFKRILLHYHSFLAMSALTVSMCWELVTIKKDKLNYVSAAIYRKPTSNECYNQRKKKVPQLCMSDDDPNAAW